MAPPIAAKAKYDLTSKMTPFLDNHLAVNLLNFLKETNLYKDDDISNAVLAAMESTYLVQPALEVVERMHNHTSAQDEAIKTRSKKAGEEMARLEEACGPLFELIRNESEIELLIAQDNFNAEYLKETFGITSDNIEAFLQYARVAYQSGHYLDSNLILFYYRGISTEQDKLLSCYWGKIAAQLLTLETNEGVMNCWKDFQMLQELILEKDDKAHQGGAHHLEILQLRTWLLHWSLFLFFKDGIVDEPMQTRDEQLAAPLAADMPAFLMNTFIEFFTQEKHLNAVQVNAPWLLRYLTAACIIQKSNKYTVRPILRAIEQEEYMYRDPVTKFFSALMSEFDFDTAMEQLKECEALLAGDFFLKPYKAVFMERARTALFETYCRVHATLDINWLSEQTGMTYEAAEKWVVHLVRAARLDAKIDSEKGLVRMGHKASNPYQKTIDMTKDLAFRSFRMASSLST